MKNYKYLSYFLIFLVILMISQDFSTLLLNYEAIMFSKNILRKNEEVITLENYSVDKNKCHLLWLSSINKFENEKNIDYEIISQLIDCSYLHSRMIVRKFPEDLIILKKINLAYKSDYDFLLKLANASIESEPDFAEAIYKQILTIRKNDGEVLTRLGRLYEDQGKFSLALEQFKKSCVNNLDYPKFKGCYNAGRLLERQNQFEQALYFYRISPDEQDQLEADRLEAELFSQNP